MEETQCWREAGVGRGCVARRARLKKRSTALAMPQATVLLLGQHLAVKRIGHEAHLDQSGRHPGSYGVVVCHRVESIVVRHCTLVTGSAGRPVALPYSS